LLGFIKVAIRLTEWLRAHLKIKLAVIFLMGISDERGWSRAVILIAMGTNEN
jgi:hypothetical protein